MPLVPRRALVSGARFFGVHAAAVALSGGEEVDARDVLLLYVVPSCFFSPTNARVRAVEDDEFVGQLGMVIGKGSADDTAPVVIDDCFPVDQKIRDDCDHLVSPVELRVGEPIDEQQHWALFERHVVNLDRGVVDVILFDEVVAFVDIDLRRLGDDEQKPMQRHGEDVPCHV
jgi:hypothetical protein